MLATVGLLTSLGLAGTGCASAGAVPKSPASLGVAAPAPVAPAAAPALPAISPVGDRKSRGFRIAETGLSLRGIPYRPGGTTRAGFDCSGFTSYVFAQNGVTLPRSTNEQSHEGKTIKRRDIKVGDLLFFKITGNETSHVAIAIGGGRFVHAPSSTGVVRVEALDSPYWSSRFMVARRVS